MSEATNLFVVDGPLSRHKLAVLRDERTPTTDFRQAMGDVQQEYDPERPGTTDRHERRQARDAGHDDAGHGT